MKVLEVNLKLGTLRRNSEKQTQAKKQLAPFGKERRGNK
jgi:hypothetical protein